MHAHDKIAERERLLMTAESPLNAGESVDPVMPPTTVAPPPAISAAPAAPLVSGSHMKSAPRPAFVPEPQPDDHIKVVRIEKTQDPLVSKVLDAFSLCRRPDNLSHSTQFQSNYSLMYAVLFHACLLRFVSYKPTLQIW